MKHEMGRSSDYAVSPEEARETRVFLSAARASPAEGREAQPAFLVDEPAETAGITRECSSRAAARCHQSNKFESQKKFQGREFRRRFASAEKKELYQEI